MAHIENQGVRQVSFRTPGSTRRKWSSKKSFDDGFSARAAGGGVVRALGMAVVLVLLGATIVYFTSLDERILTWLVNLGSFVIVGLAAFLTARKQMSHGLVYGLAIGAAYALITVLAGTVLFPPFIGFVAFLKRLGFCLVAGACGGILGVNT